jgi:uncharacterized membrane protein
MAARKRRFSLAPARSRRAGQCGHMPARRAICQGRSMTPPLKRFVHMFRVRPRLFIVLVLGVLTGLLLPQGLVSQPVTRWLLAWNIGAGLYIALAAAMMIQSSQDHMRHRAQLQDDGKYAILFLTVVAAIASLVAIAFELAVVKDLHGWTRGAHIALAGVTVVASWGFIQIMFTLHYAHDYYLAACHGHKPGLAFPDDPDPDYGDFFYFAAVIGTSGQTADVSFVTKPMRRIGSLHCILAYLFNTTVLALLINIGASLF